MELQNLVGFFNFCKKYAKHIENNSNYEKSLFNYIQNKTVAIVGPAPGMKNKKLGIEIDKHDVVIRLNHGMELAETNSEDFGKKTHILFINQKMRRHYKDNFPKKWLELPFFLILYQKTMGIFNHYKKKGFRINCELCHKFIEKTQLIDVHPIHSIVHDACLNKTSQIKEKHVKIYMDHFREYFGDIDFVLGFRTVLHMLLYKPKQISVYGFDFYRAAKMKTKKYDYSDIYIENYQILDGSIDLEAVGDSNHKDDNNVQLHLFKSLYEKIHMNPNPTTKLIIDENLHNILYNIPFLDDKKNIENNI